MPHGYVPVNGVEIHLDRDCGRIRRLRVDILAIGSPRAGRFEGCPWCAPQLRRAARADATLAAALGDLPPSQVASMRVGVERRQVMIREWLARQTGFLDITADDVVIELRDGSRQGSLSYARPKVSRRKAYTSASSFHAS